MFWRKTRKSMFCPIVELTLALVIYGTSPVRAAKRVALNVDLDGPAVAAQWVLSPKGGASITGGELVLDTLNRGGVRVFLRQPTLGDPRLSCKTFVESKGPGGPSRSVSTRPALPHTNSSTSTAAQQFSTGQIEKIAGTNWSGWPVREKKAWGSTSRCSARVSGFDFSWKGKASRPFATNDNEKIRRSVGHGPCDAETLA